MPANAPIFCYIIDNQEYFEGVGTSHCSKILHIAEEHPATLARLILQSPQRRVRLCDAVRTLYAKAYSRDYIQRVPARSSGSAFYESQGTTRYINEQFYQVHGKTIAGVLIPVKRYDRMVRDQQLDPIYKLSTTTVGNRQPRPTNKKRVKVYTIYLRKKRGIAFTCIYLPPPYADNKTITKLSQKAQKPLVLSREEGIRKGLSTTGRPELGIASFADTKSIEDQERYSTYRRFPLYSGAVGRPRLTKRLYKVQSGTIGSKRGKMHELGLAPSEYNTRRGGLFDREDSQDVDLAVEDQHEGKVEIMDTRGGIKETVVARGVLSGLTTELEEDAEAEDDEDDEE